MKNKSDLQASRQAASKQAASSQESELRQRAEALHSQRNRQEPQTQIDPQRLIHELEVHQIQLEMQNEELRQMQVQLEAARTKYSDLFDFAPVGYLTLNKEGVILEANLTAARMLGVTRSRLISQSLKRFILPEYQDTYYLHRQALFANDALQTCELRLFNKGAIPFWARFEANLVQNEDETPVCHIAVSDISEHKQAGLALQISEKFLNTIIEENPFSMWISDARGTLIRINKICCDLLRIRPEEVIGKYNVLKDDIVEAQGLMPLVKRVYENGEAARFELDYNTSNLKQILFENTTAFIFDVSIYPIMDASGMVTNAVIQYMDISERKQIEVALSEIALRLSASEQSLRQIFQISPVAIAIWQPDSGLILEANAVFLNLFGYTADEVIGKTSRELNLFGSWENRQVATAKSRQNGSDRNVRSRMQRKDGSLLIGLFSVETIQYQGQKCMVSAIVDISEMEKMHATLLEAQKMAGLGTLVAGLAHEMNSPLQVITGSVDNLLNKLKIGDPITPEHMEKYLGNASRNAWRIAEMVRALMIYAHPMKMNMEACDINRLVQDGILLTENQYKINNIHVQLALEEGLPELQCEASDLVQTLVTLLKNASDALPDGGQITLSSAYDAAQEEINLTVEDDGVGIEPENLDKIFDPFFTTKPPGQGVGLGLTVMQGVMRKYGGSIKVESVPGKGSAFHLTFPLKDSAAKTKNPFTAEGRYAEIKPENRENT